MLDIEKRFIIFKTLMEMLSDRGYSIMDHIKNISESNFYRMQLLSDENTIIKVQHKKDQEGLFIFFDDTEKVGVKEIRNYVIRMKENDIKKSIIILKNNLTAIARQSIVEEMPAFLIEYFLDKELMFNVTKHIYVPHHQLLSETEKKKFLEEYKIKEHQLPKILTTDPVSRYYGFLKGQVIKITRYSETSNKYVLYRVVV